jgi:hypothetical protein
MLYQFLEEHDVDIPQGHDNWKPWKHLPEPPSDDEVKDGFRAVYLFSNPMNAILSVFRREFQYWHVRAMNMDDDYNAWGDDSDLEDFLEQNTDHFRMARHFHNWTQADRSYPILLLRFDALWEHLPEFFAFAGLPTKALDEFPEQRERASDWTEEPEYVRERLQDFYGDLWAEIQETPDFHIR